jgi:hypothetical protein
MRVLGRQAAGERGGDGRGQPGGGVEEPERAGERGAMGIGARGMLRWAMGNGTVGGGKGRERGRLARKASQSSGKD